MKKLASKYQDPKIFNNQFIIKEKLSAGSFGTVYLAFDKYTREEVAIKVEKSLKSQVGTLEREIEILECLIGTEGVPQMVWSGYE